LRKSDNRETQAPTNQKCATSQLKTHRFALHRASAAPWNGRRLGQLVGLADLTQHAGRAESTRRHSVPERRSVAERMRRKYVPLGVESTSARELGPYDEYQGRLAQGAVPLVAPECLGAFSHPPIEWFASAFYHRDVIKTSK